MDTLERNKANVHRVFDEGFSQGRLDVVDEALAPDAVDRHPFEPGEPDFRSHLKAAITMFRAAMPDLHASVEDIVAEGSTVAARVRMTGTHTGAPLFGIPAAGHSVDIEQFHFIHSDDQGHGVRHWANVGADELRNQITAS
ncbi:MAG TPA: ester cyclase [Candidatus Nanopelagicales bacterium]|jgi:predicted ester cyclase